MKTSAEAASIARYDDILEKIQNRAPRFPNPVASAKSERIAMGAANRILHFTAHLSPCPRREATKAAMKVKEAMEASQ